jgi:hypothetical protein
LNVLLNRLQHRRARFGCSMTAKPDLSICVRQANHVLVNLRGKHFVIAW